MLNHDTLNHNHKMLTLLLLLYEWRWRHIYEGSPVKGRVLLIVAFCIFYIVYFKAHFTYRFSFLIQTLGFLGRYNALGQWCFHKYTTLHLFLKLILIAFLWYSHSLNHCYLRLQHIVYYFTLRVNSFVREFLLIILTYIVFKRANCYLTFTIDTGLMEISLLQYSKTHII